MNFNKLITLGLVAIITALSTSCGSLPERPKKHVGPVSDESTIPWNRRLPGEGQAALGGIGQ